MFRNEFQGGPYFEIFSAQGKDSTSNWKLLNGPGIKKLFDKEVKGYVYTLEGTPATTKLQLPKDSKHSLTLIQHYLVVQLYLVKGQDFSIELGVTDMGNSKRRIVLSTSQKETQVTPLHARIPLAIVRRAVWLNLCLDMVSLVGETWKGQTFRAIESVAISANCKLKRVFTMKVQPPDTTDDDELYECNNSNMGEVDAIPKQCQLAPDIAQCTQVLTLNKIKHGERLRGGGAGGDLSRPSSMLELDLNSSGRKSTSGEPYHIAFGSKVPSSNLDTSRKSARQGNVSNRSFRSTLSRADDGYGTGSYPDLSVSITSRDGLPTGRDSHKHSSHQDLQLNGSASQSAETSHKSKPGSVEENENQNISKGSMVTPHPPREPSKDRLRRRPRVKNVGNRDRQSSAGSLKEESSTSDPSGQQASNYTTVTSTSDLYSHNHSTHTDVSEMDFSSGGASSMWSRSEREVVGQSYPGGATEVETAQQSPDIPSQSRGYRVVHKNPNRSSREMGVGPDVPEIQTPKDESGFQMDDSVSDVIGLLKEERFQYGRHVEDAETESSESEVSSSAPDSYQESDDEESSDQNHLHVFAVPPKSAPQRKMSPNTNDADSSRKPASRTQRSNSKTTLEGHGGRGAKPEGDFIKSSSSEEEDYPSKYRKPTSRPHSGSSRPNSGTSSTGASPKTKDQQGGSGGTRGGSGSKTRPHINSGPTASSISPEQRAGQFNPALYATDQQNGSVHPNVVSRVSLKTLQEIPSTDARISNGRSERQYDFTRYQPPMEDLTESFEAQMFLSMKRQQQEEEAPDSPRKDINALNRSPRRSRQMDQLSPHMYSDSAPTTSDDDTSFSTWKAPAANQMPHNYQDEMKSRLSSDTLTSSNPRDWSGVFSPPIVLPGDLNNTGHLVEELSDSAVTPDGGYMSYSQSSRSNGVEEPDDEKVNLLFDPGLNCYYDPVTRKYYELKSTPGGYG